jgi:2-polyprenyl-3-methyl-5-hydroxy-6-metoxy-1,4-benzoquinol methylase
MDKEQNIILSWQVNANNWIAVVEANGIESRSLATNEAIINAVCAADPVSILDIGCGEGWLAKELFDKGFEVTGIDIVPELIEKAKQKTPGHFFVASYGDLYNHKIEFLKSFDAVVINFALIGKESTENLLGSLPGYLTPKGKLFIQTLHPHNRKQINDYVTGWKQGSWDGLGDQFTMPYEWYFRTMEDWIELLDRSGYTDIKISEVLHPHTFAPLSVLFTCRLP